jgi:hypothetical protein
VVFQLLQDDVQIFTALGVGVELVVVDHDFTLKSVKQGMLAEREVFIQLTSSLTLLV